MRSVFLALIAVFLSLPVRAAAQDIVPPLVTRGLNAYRYGGPAAALDEWTAGWPEATSSEVKSQMLGRLKEIETITGPITGHDFLGAAQWGAHTRRIYFTLLGRDRPAFLRLDIYQTGSTWRVLNVTINTDPAQVFTPEMLSVPR